MKAEFTVINERDFLESEVTTLKQLLETVPADHLIERISLQSRLDNVQAELNALPESTSVEKSQVDFSQQTGIGKLMTNDRKPTEEEVEAILTRLRA